MYSLSCSLRGTRYCEKILIANAMQGRIFDGLLGGNPGWGVVEKLETRLPQEIIFAEAERVYSNFMVDIYASDLARELTRT